MGRRYDELIEKAGAVHSRPPQEAGEVCGLAACEEALAHLHGEDLP